MTTWMVANASTVLQWVGTMVLALFGLLHWRSQLVDRIHAAGKIVFWAVEDEIVAPMKAAAPDGHLTDAQAAQVLAAAKRRMFGMVGLRLVGRLVAALFGFNVENYITQHLTALAGTLNKSPATAVDGGPAVPLDVAPKTQPAPA